MKNMKNNTGRLFVTAVLTVIFLTGSARAADFGSETQNLMTETITRALEANINNMANNMANNATAGNVSSQPVLQEIQNRMMTQISGAIKENTAVRKRETVVATCLECRALQPIEVVVSGESPFLDADIQERINQAMAKRIEETIRVISSDPAVASMVQERMMAQRMATSPLQQDMQPFIMSGLLSDPGAINVANNTTEDANNPLTKATCSTTDSRYPNC